MFQTHSYLYKDRILILSDDVLLLE